MRAAWLLALLAVAASAQQTRSSRSYALDPWYDLAHQFARGPSVLCRSVPLAPTTCRGAYRARARPLLPSVGVWMDTTVTIGRWRGETVRFHFMGSPGDLLDTAWVVARHGQRVVDAMEFEASRLFGLWTFCSGTSPPDIDGDGLREVGIGLANGGGPFSVNVSVAFVRFDGSSRRLGFWPLDPGGYDPLYGPPTVTTPRMIRGGTLLESQHRYSGFGREWTLERYRVPADTLKLVEAIHYRAVAGTEGDWETYTYERTEFAPGQPDRTRLVRAAAVPFDESERFGCP